ncbi:hypothetical protein, partial [Pseudomonas aeruginosa]|uniref:hypothetical protein n=1 Tax=Pseudomonas aeruginosa TaxID=287 RepID=UPI001F2CBBD5
MPGSPVLDKNCATGLETLFHQGVIGGNQKFAGDSHGKNTENCATFCAPLAKSCAIFSVLPMRIASEFLVSPNNALMEKSFKTSGTVLV